MFYLPTYFTYLLNSVDYCSNPVSVIDNMKLLDYVRSERKSTGQRIEI